MKRNSMFVHHFSTQLHNEQIHTYIHISPWIHLHSHTSTYFCNHIHENTHTKIRTLMTRNVSMAKINNCCHKSQINRTTTAKKYVPKDFTYIDGCSPSWKQKPYHILFSKHIKTCTHTLEHTYTRVWKYCSLT